MGNQIKSKPEAIRAAGSNIASLKATTVCSGIVSKLPLTEGNSDGLVAEGINLIIDELISEELNSIMKLMDSILTKFPQKLEDVADVIESHDNAAANQFK